MCALRVHLGPDESIFGQLRQKDDIPTCDYKRVFKHRFELGRPKRKKRTVGSTKRSCRICGRPRSEASFQQRCHVIPEGLGNRELFSDEECDDCNQDPGSKLEDNLIKFLSPFRAVLTVTVKKGGATHRLREGGSSISVSPHENETITFNIRPNDKDLRILEKSDNRIVFRARQQPYSLNDVGKAIARMGILAMPKGHFNVFKYLANWVSGKVEHKCNLTLALLNHFTTESSLEVYKAKKVLLHEPPLVVGYQFSQLQIFWHAPSHDFKLSGRSSIPESWHEKYSGEYRGPVGFSAKKEDAFGEGWVQVELNK